jgi:hypothetical protein
LPSNESMTQSRSTPPSDEATQHSCPKSSARSSRRLKLAVIAEWTHEVQSYITAMSAPPSQLHHQVGGSRPMAPPPLIHQVKSPSTSMACTPPPACLVKTSASQSSLSPSPPCSKGREQAWQNIMLPLSSRAGNGASGFAASLTSRLGQKNAGFASKRCGARQCGTKVST